MRQFTVRHSCLVFSDGRLCLYLQLEHSTIYVRLRPTLHNFRYGRRIRAVVLEEKIVVPMRGINEYRGRMVLLR